MHMFEYEWNGLLCIYLIPEWTRLYVLHLLQMRMELIDDRQRNVQNIFCEQKDAKINIRIQYTPKCD